MSSCTNCLIRNQWTHPMFFESFALSPDRHRNSVKSSYCSFQHECPTVLHAVSKFLEGWIASWCCFPGSRLRHWRQNLKQSVGTKSNIWNGDNLPITFCVYIVTKLHENIFYILVHTNVTLLVLNQVTEQVTANLFGRTGPIGNQSMPPFDEGVTACKVLAGNVPLGLTVSVFFTVIHPFAQVVL